MGKRKKRERKIKVKPSTYIAYTDGSALGNPGPGGYAAIVKHGDIEVELSQGYYKTTNNRMELMAVIAVLEEFGPNESFEIFTDSQYVIKGCTQWVRGWARNNWVAYSTGGPVKNKDLWVIMHELLKQNKVRLHWVRGHSGDENNERADKLAKAAAANPDTQDVEYMNVIGI